MSDEYVNSFYYTCYKLNNQKLPHVVPYKPKPKIVISPDSNITIDLTEYFNKYPRLMYSGIFTMALYVLLKKKYPTYKIDVSATSIRIIPLGNFSTTEGFAEGEVGQLTLAVDNATLFDQEVSRILSILNDSSTNPNLPIVGSQFDESNAKLLLTLEYIKTDNINIDSFYVQDKLVEMINVHIAKLGYNNMNTEKKYDSSKFIITISMPTTTTNITSKIEDILKYVYMIQSITNPVIDIFLININKAISQRTYTNPRIITNLIAKQAIYELSLVIHYNSDQDIDFTSKTVQDAIINFIRNSIILTDQGTDETTQSGTTQSGTTQSGTTQSGTTQSGTTQSGIQLPITSNLVNNIFSITVNISITTPDERTTAQTMIIPPIINNADIEKIRVDLGNKKLLISQNQQEQTSSSTQQLIQINTPVKNIKNITLEIKNNNITLNYLTDIEPDIKTLEDHIKTELDVEKVTVSYNIKNEGFATITYNVIINIIPKSNTDLNILAKKINDNIDKLLIIPAKNTIYLYILIFIILIGLIAIIYKLLYSK